MHEADSHRAAALVVGGEGAACRTALVDRADLTSRRSRWRRRSNRSTCAVAAALLVYEARRQRAPCIGGSLDGLVRHRRPFFADDAHAARPGPGRSPLAERMRPRTLDEVVGQEALLGAGRAAARGDRARRPAVADLLGPARHRQDDARALIAERTEARFVSFSAVLAGIKEIKEVMARAEATRRQTGQRTILFVDEIHRFNKAQQDAFLPYVEAGTIILIGATTENPSFEVNAALLSRSKVYVLEPLQLRGVVDDPAARARRCRNAALAREPLDVDDEALALMARLASGDARSALNMLELAAHAAPKAAGDRRRVDRAVARARVAAPDAALRQERRRALQPDLRAAQVDAQQRSGCRRLLARADARGRRGSALRRAAPGALRLRGRRQRRSAGARPWPWRPSRPRTSSACPKGNTALAQAAIYLATAPKSNAVYAAYGRAADDARAQVADPVPLHLRNAPTKLMKQLDYGKDYQLRARRAGRRRRHGAACPSRCGTGPYYQPTERGFEKEIKRRLEGWKEIKKRRKGS